MAENTELVNLIKNGKEIFVLDFINKNEHNLGQVDAAFVSACQTITMKNVAIKLLPHVLNVGHVDENNNTGLLYACKSNISEVALAILEKKNCKSDHVDNYDYTALIFACKNNLPRVALVLSRRDDSNPGHVDNYGNTALIYACKNNLQEVALVLSKRDDYNPGHIDIYNKNTAFIYACKNNLREVALVLSKRHDSNPSHINNFEKTAIFYASMNHMGDVIRNLLMRGSRPNEKSLFYTFEYEEMDDISIKLIKNDYCQVEELMLKKIFDNTNRKNLQMCILKHFNDKILDPDNGSTFSILQYLGHKLSEAQKQEFQNICTVPADTMYTPNEYAEAHLDTNDTTDETMPKKNVEAIPIYQGDIATRQGC